MTPLQHLMASVAGVLAISVGAQALAADTKKESPTSAPTVATTQAPPAASTDPVVKKSDSGICHDKSSPSFGNTKKFTPFNAMEECIKSGGKPAANAAAPAPEVSMVKKSDSGICHDKSSPSYEKTKKFTEFKSMDECIKSGGRAPK
jgi:cytochrome c5